MAIERFGVNLPPSAAAGTDPVAYAREAESLGYDFVSTSDHPCGTSPSFEVWTLLTWVAASTSRIGITTRVLGVPYRAPAMVAKMAESLSRLSGGRFTLGLGGGYSDEEFQAFGLGVPTPRQKVDGLGEAIQIMHGLWEQPEFTFHGDRYQIEAAAMEPKPAHRIPIWLGTYGPRALDVTGRLADGWIPSLGFAPPAQIGPMRDRILAAAESAGRDPACITCVYNVQVHVGEAAEQRPHVLSGAPEAIAERLTGFAALGFTAVNIMPVGPADQSSRIATEVMPLVKA
jgi:probable F420-dependent oxidoreductase